MIGHLLEIERSKFNELIKHEGLTENTLEQSRKVDELIICFLKLKFLAV
ncbi:MAG: hypothetical protein N2645_03840 [Clostridia bacterium]|nr:hypothetical protein [Clostridia bacterium]